MSNQKTAEECLESVIRQHINVQETETPTLSELFRSMWFLYDPSPSMHFVLEAMHTFAEQKTAEMKQDNEAMFNALFTIISNEEIDSLDKCMVVAGDVINGLIYKP